MANSDDPAGPSVPALPDGPDSTPTAKKGRSLKLRRRSRAKSDDNTPKKPRSLLRRVLGWIGLLVLLVVVAFLVFVWWAAGGQTHEDAVAKSDLIVMDADAAPPAAAETLSVMAFNIGYGRGPEGDYVGPWEEAHIVRHLDGIAAQIAGSGADIAALQEVDLDSARTHGIHEGRYLAKKLGWNWLSCTYTWENNYVPFPYWPPSRHYGRMASGQCTLSRFPITSAVRYRLPQPESNPFWKNWFYMHRAIDHVEIMVGGQKLHLYNVHLEAFEIHNREVQVDALRGLVNGLADKHAIALGDFNALPARTAKTTGYTDEKEADFTDDTTMARADTMVDMREVLHGTNPFTFPAHAANRRLDYIYYRATGLERVSAKVLDTQPPWSDHLPVVAVFRLLP